MAENEDHPEETEVPKLTSLDPTDASIFPEGQNAGKSAVPRAANPAEAQNLLQERHLTAKDGRIRDSYFKCANDFYTLAEMKKYIRDHHNVTEQSVTLVFRELIKGQNAENYLRVSNQRALVRKQIEDQRWAREALVQRLADASAAEIGPHSQQLNRGPSHSSFTMCISALPNESSGISSPTPNFQQKSKHLAKINQ